MKERTIAQALAALFAIYGVIAVALLATTIPPFQNPDEPAHLMRAEQIARGGIWGRHVTFRMPNGSEFRTSGGLADPALLQAASPFWPIFQHPDVRAIRAMWAPDVHWSDALTPAQFNNTALYPPIFYIPAAIGVAIGRAADLSVVRTLTLARLLTGAASVAVGTIAIAAARGLAVWLFAILTLPMSLACMASAAQDGLLITSAALAAVLLLRLRCERRARAAAVLVVLTMVLGAVGAARPPYIGLALLPLAARAAPLGSRILAAAAVLLIVGAWSATAMMTAYAPFVIIGADPQGQIASLIRDPPAVASIARDTLVGHWREYATGFVGSLGWQDLAFSAWYYDAAFAALAAGLAAAMLRPRDEGAGARASLLVLLGVLISAAAIFGIEYLSWTPPGAPGVEGVQGRYFLPLALVAGLALPALGGGRGLARFRSALLLAVSTFPVVSIVETMRGIVGRYYLQ
jgi:uncharacterized membrane protein